ncbi:RidA family protein, partial [Peribacillus butanolivorans]
MLLAQDMKLKNLYKRSKSYEKNIVDKKEIFIMKEAVLTSNAPQPIGPYSQAVLSKGILYISGQLPLNPNTNKLAIGIEDQARQCLENLKH